MKRFRARTLLVCVNERTVEKAAFETGEIRKRKIMNPGIHLSMSRNSNVISYEI